MNTVSSRTKLMMRYLHSENIYLTQRANALWASIDSSSNNPMPTKLFRNKKNGVMWHFWLRSIILAGLFQIQHCLEQFLWFRHLSDEMDQAQWWVSRGDFIWSLRKWIYFLKMGLCRLVKPWWLLSDGIDEFNRLTTFYYEKHIPNQI